MEIICKLTGWLNQTPAKKAFRIRKAFTTLCGVSA